MTTKTELLNQLSRDQLMEIAIAEGISVSEKAKKEELVRCLLLLTMPIIRQHVAEYQDQERPKSKGILGPILETASSLVGEDFGELIREKMIQALRDESHKGNSEQDDFETLVKQRIAQSLEQGEQGKPAQVVGEKKKPQASANHLKFRLFFQIESKRVMRISIICSLVDCLKTTQSF